MVSVTGSCTYHVIIARALGADNRAANLSLLLFEHRSQGAVGTNPAEYVSQTLTFHGHSGGEPLSSRYARADENFVLASDGRERAGTFKAYSVADSDFTDPQGPLLTS